MNTIGVLFDNKTKSYPTAPDMQGKFELTEAFLKSAVEAWRAMRADGKVECVIEARKAKGQAVEFWRLNIIPPKVG